MKNRILSTREVVLLLILAVLLVCVSYYKFFYQPLQIELDELANQSAQLDSSITLAAAKTRKLAQMKKELEEILSQPEDQITEIAPFDNAKVVMSQLDGILSASENYRLAFKDPVIESDGTVRRNVSMEFRCPDYANAKAIIQALSASHWRCLINSLSVDIISNYQGPAAANAKTLEAERAAEAAAIAASVQAVLAGRTAAQKPQEPAKVIPEEPEYQGILNSPVSVRATIVFFESTSLNR